MRKRGGERATCTERGDQVFGLSDECAADAQLPAQPGAAYGAQGYMRSRARAVAARAAAAVVMHKRGRFDQHNARDRFTQLSDGGMCAAPMRRRAACDPQQHSAKPGDEPGEAMGGDGAARLHVRKILSALRRRSDWLPAIPAFDPRSGLGVAGRAVGS